ncbi:hypothetical protein P775_14420 [Puniceibacterium antarcticum]|uniref:EamA domain-containing protein n=1 Tax=Puniceibacterium antarcticum TaxID=1206336 RepID=A0A2G8RCR9_9RHOB|nr:hypothetical protein P775_14420 [Puniceibacterium antarcticum]
MLGYDCIILATRTGDVFLITLSRYSRLIFALILGILVFGKGPDLLTFVGAALIIASGLYTILRERYLVRNAARQGAELQRVSDPLALTDAVYFLHPPAIGRIKD